MDIVGKRNRLGYQQITGLSSAQSLTIPAGANAVLIQCEAQPVRWRGDGTAPTASTGMRLQIASDGLFIQTELSKLSFIEEAASAKLNVVYFD